MNGGKQISEIVNEWWKTELRDGDLIDLTPSPANREMIPFLQMANGKTKKLGCAYEFCDHHDRGDYVLFVCAYGQEKIRIGNPLYTRGPPCGSCWNKCTFNRRLCAV
ncbi:hypothetical protein DICVIV_12943 [Dictyocaulus viviparus]|uniref:SCP domain-containing protein n=1 Tax=Dictyocaulus viviparus TaxID=29172 RepID=A0A0D8XF71_DICVI|nr:hypothetical protein DICVIV_12943 [Dictyocaulus viviparus]